ncbi:STAS-like domain-containing protein [Paracidovorax citrulli]
MERASNGGDSAADMAMVPIRFLQSCGTNLASRASAQRLLTPLRRFHSVVLDFRHIESIGRSFADEIFHVFADANPHIEIIAINANPAVASAISDVRSGLARDTAIWAFLEEEPGQRGASDPDRPR